MAISEIIKRDGRTVPFDSNKISNAMRKAFRASKQEQPDVLLAELVVEVMNRLESENSETPNVEQIQDIVEKVLVDAGHIVVARNYHEYRVARTRARESNTTLMKIFADITYSDSADSEIKRENANVNGDTAMGVMLKYGSEGAKHFYLTNVVAPEFARAHENGDIHIHDLDFYTMTTTCCQIDLTKLFEGGFGTGHGALREPQDISSYAALACIAIQSNQNDQHGGQSIPNFDYAMAKGVEKTYRRCYSRNIQKALALLASEGEAYECPDVSGLTMDSPDLFLSHERGQLTELGYSDDVIDKAQEFAMAATESETDRATYQAMEALIHNLNTMHSRAGAQTPFSSINYGMDTSEAGRTVIKNVLLAQEAGLGNGETPIFPIHIFRVKEGINAEEGDPNYDLFQLACRVSAKRLFPNFSFQDAPYNLAAYDGRPETEIAYMGCRTRVIGNVYDPSRAISFSRGNLSFTSINLPRIAYYTGRSIDLFFDELGRKIDLCVAQLLERLTIQSRRKVKNFPFLMGEGLWLDSDKLKPDDCVEEVLKHGTLSVGFIGLAETLKLLTGFHHGEKESSQNLGLDIVSFMRNKLDEKAQERKLNFTLLATPAEGLAGRFLRMDRERFGVIEGVTDHDYYTNSFHIPVYFPISAYDKIRLEAPYHALTNAGHITYVEADGDLTKNPEAFESIVHAMRKAGIGYGAINHPVDYDPVCGYTGIIDDVCPQCGRKEGDVPFDRIRRITGYLVGTLDRFNGAKKSEVMERVTHVKGASVGKRC